MHRNASTFVNCVETGICRIGIYKRHIRHLPNCFNVQPHSKISLLSMLGVKTCQGVLGGIPNVEHVVEVSDFKDIKQIVPDVR